MTMQQTPLLMSRLLGRGARLDPNIEIVTLQEEGTQGRFHFSLWICFTVFGKKELLIIDCTFYTT